MTWASFVSLIFAVNFAWHAASVYQKFGFWAYCVVLVFMLTFGECIRVWLKMIRSR